MTCRSLLSQLFTFAALSAAFVCLGQPGEGEPQSPAAFLSFDGNLLDGSGNGNDAYLADATFVPGRRGNALRPSKKPAIIPDTADLRLMPGIRLDCWVKLDSLKAGRDLVVKKNEYMLRVNPAGEGGGFAFFVYSDGWEPRACTQETVRLGEWYHLVGGWDGKEVWLRINDQQFRAERPGLPAPTGNPVVVGPFDGVIDDLRIDNPQAKTSGVAYWPFDGNLRDVSGHGHGIEAAVPAFAEGRIGQALVTGGSALTVPDHPDFQLAPGFRIECSVYFSEIPKDITILVQKGEEYMLRVNPPKEGSVLAFFVNLGGWEPRVNANVPVKPNVWYRIIAQWDGRSLSLDVNGNRTQTMRTGLPVPSAEPLTIGPFPGKLDNLRIENPRLPVVRMRDLLQTHALLRAGRPETVTARIENCGSGVENAKVELRLSGDVICRDPLVRELGSMPTGAATSIAWTLQATQATNVGATLRITGDGMAPVTTGRTLAFLAATDPASPLAAIEFPATNRAGNAYYVDGVAGDNANAGTSPGTAWRDFTNINGETLGAGERLLIRRGSVINQELVVSAKGEPDAWAEIGPYGEGARPIIRRNWDIADRCVLVRDPDYLRIRGLVVSHAAQGIVVNYWHGGHAGLFIEDCVAHHIEGLYRPNANGIPEWRDRPGPQGAALNSSAGIAIVGANARNLLIRDCEMFQCSWGYFVKGENAIVDRVYCHDNYALNTSPHPAMVAVRRSYLQNSVFDAPGFHASAGTMGIMLVDPQGFVVRNCTFRNQPDSGSHDEGGIDFEAAGNGCLVDGCTFQNNAGAAIEVLGLQSPQIKNLEIARCRFIKNNVARKLGPSEVYIWGRSKAPEVCCSTGTVHDNGYITNEGVEFFVNEAPELTQWTVRDNTEYPSVEQLKKAMPYNDPPVVDAGEDIRTNEAAVRLTGRAQDAQPLKTRWEVLEGPGPVAFRNAEKPVTTASFSAPGDYVLRLVADDGELWLSDMVVVHILPPGGKVAKAWEFNEPLDKEGWSEANTGTKLMHWKNANWPTKSDPVKYVAGSYYIIALENTTDAYLLSATDLALPLAANPCVKIRFQNHTPATRMRFRFTTDSQPDWDAANGKSFAVTPNDNAPREYVVDMSDVAGWQGTLKQLRLDLATGTPLTGTCRIDYIWIGTGLGN
jgi:hypothetical protein